ncbi:hypothetical protein T4B_7802 [Trichinella pseudospiralis]|uniref:Uncharacterized protein n=1 Tax=Trichinella pseudospiralis TaxID=6337 RepID=A0A0V1ERA9_TRIPS|nr:hypothetical protein T4A_9601 [Trichinella pseudospiralis]KRZ01910.1 hypothetical protein T4B_7802 [Trichinella pseudospiralis]
MTDANVRLTVPYYDGNSVRWKSADSLVGFPSGDLLTTVRWDQRDVQNRQLLRVFSSW